MTKQQIVNQIVNLTIQAKGALHNEDWEQYEIAVNAKKELEKQLH